MPKINTLKDFMKPESLAEQYSNIMNQPNKKARERGLGRLETFIVSQKVPQSFEARFIKPVSPTLGGEFANAQRYEYRELLKRAKGMNEKFLWNRNMASWSPTVSGKVQLETVAKETIKRLEMYHMFSNASTEEILAGKAKMDRTIMGGLESAYTEAEKSRKAFGKIAKELNKRVFVPAGEGKGWARAPYVTKPSVEVSAVEEARKYFQRIAEGEAGQKSGVFGRLARMGGNTKGLQVLGNNRILKSWIGGLGISVPFFVESGKMVSYLAGAAPSAAVWGAVSTAGLMGPIIASSAVGLFMKPHMYNALKSVEDARLIKMRELTRYLPKDFYEQEGSKLASQMEKSILQKVGGTPLTQQTIPGAALYSKLMYGTKAAPAPVPLAMKQGTEAMDLSKAKFTYITEPYSFFRSPQQGTGLGTVKPAGAMKGEPVVGQPEQGKTYMPVKYKSPIAQIDEMKQAALATRSPWEGLQTTKYMKAQGLAAFVQPGSSATPMEAIASRVAKETGLDTAPSLLRSPVMASLKGVTESRAAFSGLIGFAGEFGLSSRSIWRGMPFLTGMAAFAVTGNPIPFLVGAGGQSIINRLAGRTSFDTANIQGLGRFIGQMYKYDRRMAMRGEIIQTMRRNVLFDILGGQMGPTSGYMRTAGVEQPGVWAREMSMIEGKRMEDALMKTFTRGSMKEKRQVIAQVLGGAYGEVSLNKQDIAALRRSLMFRTKMVQGGSTLKSFIGSLFNPMTAGGAVFTRKEASAIYRGLSEASQKELMSYSGRVGATFANIGTRFKMAFRTGFGLHAPPEPTVRDYMTFLRERKTIEKYVATYGAESKEVKELMGVMGLAGKEISAKRLLMEGGMGVLNLAFVGHWLYTDYKEGRPMNLTGVGALSFELAFLLGHHKLIGAVSYAAGDIGALAGEGFARVVGRGFGVMGKIGGWSGRASYKTLYSLFGKESTLLGRVMSKTATGLEKVIGSDIAKMMLGGGRPLAAFATLGRVAGGALGLAAGFAAWMILPMLPELALDITTAIGKEERLKEAMSYDMRYQQMSNVFGNPFAMSVLSTERQRAAMFAKQAGMNFQAALGDEAYLYHTV